MALVFEVEATSPAGIQTTWKSKASTQDEVICAIPPEFAGPGGGFSPEDFFAMSALNCVIATFKVYAEKSGQTFDKVQGSIKATMGKDPKEKCFCVTNLDFRIDITGASDVEKVKATMQQAFKECAICASVKCEKSVTLNVS